MDVFRDLSLLAVEIKANMSTWDFVKLKGFQAVKKTMNKIRKGLNQLGENSYVPSI